MNLLTINKSLLITILLALLSKNVLSKDDVCRRPNICDSTQVERLVNKQAFSLKEALDIIAVSGNAIAYQLQPFEETEDSTAIFMEKFKVSDSRKLSQVLTQSYKKIATNHRLYLPKSIQKMCPFFPDFAVSLFSGDENERIDILYSTSCNLVQFHYKGEWFQVNSDAGANSIKQFYQHLFQ